MSEKGYKVVGKVVGFFAGLAAAGVGVALWGAYPDVPGPGWMIIIGLLVMAGAAS